MQLGRLYDKVGRVMGLTYPAGREIDELAHQGQAVYDFLVPWSRRQSEFSFSGLKSALSIFTTMPSKGRKFNQQAICQPPSKSVMDILMAKTKKEKYPLKLWSRQVAWQLKASENA